MKSPTKYYEIFTKFSDALQSGMKETRSNFRLDQDWE